MVENDAIKKIQYRIDTASEIAGKGEDGKAFEDLEMAIQALEEIRQYRAIGTVEEIQKKLAELDRWHTYTINNKIKNPFANTSTLICHNCDHKDEYIEELEAEIDEYRSIGTIEECREVVEKIKAMGQNESMITLSLYFEIHDVDIYGGKGTIEYFNTNVDFKVSLFAKTDINSYVEMQRQWVAEMCEVDKEKVIIISRTDYEKEAADEGEGNNFGNWEEKI